MSIVIGLTWWFSQDLNTDLKKGVAINLIGIDLWIMFLIYMMSK